MHCPGQAGRSHWDRGRRLCYQQPLPEAGGWGSRETHCIESSSGGSSGRHTALPRRGTRSSHRPRTCCRLPRQASCGRQHREDRPPPDEGPRGAAETQGAAFISLSPASTTSFKDGQVLQHNLVSPPKLQLFH